MPSAIFLFPPEFLWGTSTSTWQMEGSSSFTNWSNWTNINNDHAGDGCGWREKGSWREDFDHAAETSQNAMRLSIEWARIQPGEEHWDEDALDHYRELLRGLVSRGIRPIVTLHHFTDPLWFTQLGGWKNEKSPLIFRTYAAKVISALKPLTNSWITINEPGTYALNGFIRGVFPPGQRHSFQRAALVLSNMAQAHAAVYELIHHEQPEASVGITTAWQGFVPYSHNIIDRVLTHVYKNLYNEAFPVLLQSGRLNYWLWSRSLPQVRNSLDFIGLNYYSSCEVHFSHFKPVLLHTTGAEQGDSGEIADEPEGFYEALSWARKFGLPVIVTGNGIDDINDRIRPDYLAGHIHQLWKAYTAGIPVKGYLHWTITDTFEWQNGWSAHFGLWAFDRETLRRTRRRSADFYALICRKRALDMEDAKKYAPRFWKRIFTDEKPYTLA